MSKIKMNYHLFITQPRVGSNFLVDSMNSSPELINFGDVLFKWAIPYKAYKLFNPIKGNPDYFNNIDYFEWLYKKNRLVFYFCKAYELKVNLVGKKKYIGAGITFRGKKYRNIKTIGVKEHYTHSRTQEVLSKIIPRDNSYSVITLSRKNLLQQYVSTQHAFASKQ
ncbi:MAG: hypothetical protein SVR94_07980, partial [Pseudomonadota bacterium]|nr:hypothetical protein [Pseudomonadota bacterium]